MTTASFAGRVEELQLLASRFRRAAAGHPQVVMFEGAAGVGKSALLEAFAERATERQKLSWVFCVSAAEGDRYQPVAEAALLATHKQLYEKLGGRRKAIESARALLPDWMSVIPVWGNIAAAIVATARALRRRRKGRAAASHVPIALDDDTEALIAAATSHPLILLLDDLHAADTEAAVQLERLIRAAGEGTQLLVVGAYRTPAPGAPDPPIRRLIATLPSAAVHVWELGELSARELEGWLQKRFPHLRVQPDFLRWLHERTGGHAVMVHTVLEHLLVRSVIRFAERRWQIVENVPLDGEMDAVAAEPAVELGGVAAEVLDVLQAASVLGNEFDGAALTALLEADELWVEDQLATAAHHRLVEALGEVDLANGDIATRYRFGSSHVRAQLYYGLPAERRTALEARRDRDVEPAPR